MHTMQGPQCIPMHACTHYIQSINQLMTSSASLNTPTRSHICRYVCVHKQLTSYKLLQSNLLPSAPVHGNGAQRHSYLWIHLTQWAHDTHHLYISEWTYPTPGCTELPLPGGESSAPEITLQKGQEKGENNKNPTSHLTHSCRAVIAHMEQIFQPFHTYLIVLKCIA